MNRIVLTTDIKKSLDKLFGSIFAMGLILFMAGLAVGSLSAWKMYQMALFGLIACAVAGVVIGMFAHIECAAIDQHWALDRAYCPHETEIVDLIEHITKQMGKAAILLIPPYSLATLLLNAVDAPVQNVMAGFGVVMALIAFRLAIYIIGEFQHGFTKYVEV